MEVLTNFGVHPVLLIGQIVNFLIVFFLLKKFLYKPILSTLKSREASIAKGLSDAEAARKLLEEAESKEKKLLQKAQVEAKKLIEEARNEQRSMLDAAEIQSKKQTDRMLKDAKHQIAEEISLAEKQLSTNITTLAVHVLEKSIADLFSENDQEVVIKKAIKKLKSN